MDVQTRIIMCSLLNKMDGQESFSDFIGLENRSRFLGNTIGKPNGVQAFEYAETEKRRKGSRV